MHLNILAAVMTPVGSNLYANGEKKGTTVVILNVWMTSKVVQARSRLYTTLIIYQKEKDKIP